MKTLLLLVTAVFCGVTSNAQNFKITFKGSGASTTVSTVRVENLTKGTSVNVNGDDTLQLSLVTGIESTGKNSSSQLTIYPNPTNESSFLEFLPPVPGNTVIRISDLTGKQVAIFEGYLTNTGQKFAVSCIGKGTYTVSVTGKNYHFSGQVISIGNRSFTSSITKVNELSAAPEKQPESVKRNRKDDTTTLVYSRGELLKFTAVSGKYSTIVVDSPEEDKTIQFEFIACTDGDNNNYPVIRIGEQIWMAQNLKTTKYRDGIPIPYYNNDTLIGARGDIGYPGYS